MSGSRKWLLGAITFLLIFVFSEILVRATLSFRYQYNFFTPHQLIINKFYPELQPILSRNLPKNAAYYRVLLLGGSVLHPDFGTVEKRLQAALQQKYPHKQVIIDNVAIPAQSSRDSRHKYQLLRKQYFDLVIYYDAINEVRANNCPPEIFKSNYDHYAFYQEVNLLMDHPEMNFTVLPYFLTLVYQKLINKINPDRLVPQQIPKPTWLKYGSNIKTGPAYRENINYIIQLARKKQEKLLLIKYAYYHPTDHPEARLINKELNKALLTKSPGLWGLTENVVKGIKVHNQVLENLVYKNPAVLYADMTKVIPSTKRYFDDICHLTDEGCRLFVEQVIATLAKEATTPPVAY